MCLLRLLCFLSLWDIELSQKGRNLAALSLHSDTLLAQHGDSNCWGTENSEWHLLPGRQQRKHQTSNWKAKWQHSGYTLWADGEEKSPNETMAMCQTEQVVRASGPERESWGDLWGKWDLVLGLQRSGTWRSKEKEGEAGGQQIWSLSLGFTNKWFSDLWQVIFLRFNFFLCKMVMISFPQLGPQKADSEMGVTVQEVREGVSLRLTPGGRKWKEAD